MHPARFHPARLLGAALCALAVTSLAACGEESTSASTPAKAAAPPPAATTPLPTPASTTYPLTLDNCGRRITFTRAPRRVVILNSSAVSEVEALVALGVQKSIVANTQSYGVSDDPGMVKEIAAIPRGGLKLNQNFLVPREQVLALKPDLVVATTTGSFDPKAGSVSRDELAKLGIASYVPPQYCSDGNPAATPEQKAAFTGATVESPFRTLVELGRIFDVQRRAAKYITEQRKLIVAAERVNRGEPAKKVLIAVPGMSMMTANGVPAVFGGGSYDDLIERAGGVDSFPGLSVENATNINTEAIASARVDLLVVGLFTGQESGDRYAADLFKKFPGWQASKSKSYVVLSDSIYPSPLNAIAVQRIADALHGIR